MLAQAECRGSQRRQRMGPVAPTRACGAPRRRLRPLCCQTTGCRGHGRLAPRAVSALSRARGSSPVCLMPIGAIRLPGAHQVARPRRCGSLCCRADAREELQSSCAVTACGDGGADACRSDGSPSASARAQHSHAQLCAPAALGPAPRPPRRVTRTRGGWPCCRGRPRAFIRAFIRFGHRQRSFDCCRAAPIFKKPLPAAEHDFFEPRWRR